MIILHGIYDNGQVKITDKNPPAGKATVEIQLSVKSWKREVKRVKLKTGSITEIIDEERYGL